MWKRSLVFCVMPPATTTPTNYWLILFVTSFRYFSNFSDKKQKLKVKQIILAAIFSTTLECYEPNKVRGRFYCNLLIAIDLWVFVLMSYCQFWAATTNLSSSSQELVTSWEEHSSTNRSNSRGATTATTGRARGPGPPTTTTTTRSRRSTPPTWAATRPTLWERSR